MDVGHQHTVHLICGVPFQQTVISWLQHMEAIFLGYHVRNLQQLRQREGREHLWNLNLGSARQSLLREDPVEKEI